MKGGFLLGFLVLVFLAGCVSQSSSVKSEITETKLTSFDGVNILEFTPFRNDLIPGDQTYVTLRIRNNALGKPARNVVASLYNLGAYRLLACNGSVIPREKVNVTHKNYTVSWSGGEGNCGEYYANLVGSDSPLFLYDLDEELPVDSHGIKRLFLGDEYDFLWGLKAPSNEIISDLYYKHDIKYLVKYDYSTDGFINLIAMSSNEFQRRKQSGESTTLSSESDQTAGPIRVTASNTQVVFASSGSQVAQDLIINVENKGNGLLQGSGNTLILRVPNGINVLSSCGEWWDECDDEVLVKNVSSSELVNKLVLHVPYKIEDSFFSDLQRNNIPVNTFTWSFEMDYTYSVSGSFELRTSPITVVGGLEE